MVYYASSKAGAIPIVGKALVALLLAVQRIKPYYPRTDQSKPTLAVRFLKRLVLKRGLCRSLRDKLAYRSRIRPVQTLLRYGGRNGRSRADGPGSAAGPIPI